MATDTKDNWSSEAYQNAASFVPKLATKVMQWLDPQKDDVILDVGCGDGVLDVQIGQILSQGTGRLHGTDSSPAMIAAANAAAASAGLSNQCTFEVLDATTGAATASSQAQPQIFNKAFSNAALHWILRAPATRADVFRSVRDAVAPNGTFAFEMGGLGNVAEMRAALLSAVARRVGLERAAAADPWFFPDESWITTLMEETVGGWKVERVEREWRPTVAERAGGVEGWVRLMGANWFDVVPEGEREECIKEVVDVLETVCAQHGGGYMISYVRLRVLARRV
ncbi:S-adenosyl-L-methionine-dependent methyltransferase [Trichocladium antarcticum]|uniref:S-adenosyl-L-methionine-dependent methyltransferase n=1 Tax=Trichocladium antarcticum TaxID=1450529 RepID=A0AAN6ZFQ0_9PEZI|nr:S-adenosyl-L-methionine-dependent methyltransferase [Trichocladium antarcticum]